MSVNMDIATPTYALPELLVDFSHIGVDDAVDTRDIAVQLRNYADEVETMVAVAHEDNGVIVRDDDDAATVRRARALLQFVDEYSSATGNAGTVPPVVIVSERVDGLTVRRATPVLVINHGDEDSPLVDVLRHVADEVESLHDNGHEVIVPESAFVDYMRESVQECGYFETVQVDRFDSNSRMVDFDEWPYNCIDWQAVADGASVDYNEFDYNGAAYLVR